MNRLVAVFFVLLLVSCIVDPTPTPTISPLPSPLETPQAVNRLEKVDVSLPTQQEDNSIMSAELLASVAGIVLSLLFSYIPGVKDRFDALDKSRKQMLMGVLLVLVAIGTFGLSCAGVVSVGVTCDKPGALGLLNLLVSALIANQAVYQITKR